MGANDLILELRRNGYEVKADGGYLDISPADLPADLLQQVIAGKSSILRELKNEQAANDSKLNDVILSTVGGLDLARRNPVKDLGGGWIVSACFQCQHCKQRTAGGLCAGNRPDLPLETALLRALPNDKGEGCEDFKESLDGGINAENTENAKKWHLGNF
jgi:hypothetical protein